MYHRYVGLLHVDREGRKRKRKRDVDEAVNPAVAMQARQGRLEKKAC